MVNQKGLVQRIERRLEDAVGDAFARVFGGSIVPQEVEALLHREASDGVQTLPGEVSLAPNDYVITLSMSDFQKISADRELTAEAFAKHLAGYIQEQRWQTYGEVVIRFEQSESLHTGQYRARAVVNPDADPRPTTCPPATAESNHAYTAEPGVPAMTDNQYRGGQKSGTSRRRALRRSIWTAAGGTARRSTRTAATALPAGAGVRARLRTGLPTPAGLSRTGRIPRTGLRPGIRAAPPGARLRSPGIRPGLPAGTRLRRPAAIRPRRRLRASARRL